MTLSAVSYAPVPLAVEVGRVLAAARIERGISLPLASNATTIREPYLRAIEDGRIEDLVAPVYARGYVRAYASYLGVEVAADRSGDLDAHLSLVDEPDRFGLPSWLVLTRPVLAAAGGVVLLLLFGAYAAYEFRSARELAAPSAAATSAAAPPIASPIPLPSTAVAAAPSPSSGPASSTTVIGLRSTEHVWVSVTVDGKTVGRFMEAGDTQSFTGHVIDVAAGKPSLEVSVDGSPYATLGVLTKQFSAAAH